MAGDSFFRFNKNITILPGDAGKISENNTLCFWQVFNFALAARRYFIIGSNTKAAGYSFSDFQYKPK
jgi:hypothetical protein